MKLADKSVKLLAKAINQLLLRIKGVRRQMYIYHNWHRNSRLNFTNEDSELNRYNFQWRFIATCNDRGDTHSISVTHNRNGIFRETARYLDKGET